MTALALALMMSLSGLGQDQAASMPTIEVDARESGNWRVTYRLGEPASQLVFQRSPDESRIATWTAPPEFELVKTAEGEAVRRRDKANFTSVSVEVPPEYRPLPADYAPFSRFGDGGIAFYSGRFFACPVSCEGEQKWNFRVTARHSSIIVDSARTSGSAEWVDKDSGRQVYVGASLPVENSDVVALVDGALPTPIRSRLLEQLPAFMHYFSGKLGALSAKPMLLVSYDVTHTPGFGRQGGTLPGQVFMHFYGSVWPERMFGAEIGDELAWFFAHEAAHLYQRQLFAPDSSDGWIHEGAAEAFAAKAMGAAANGSSPAVQKRIAEAESQCKEQLKGRSIREAIGQGTFDVAYSCGMLLNLNIDARLQAQNPQGDGLFGLWRRYFDQVADGGVAGEGPFLAALRAAQADGLAREVEGAVRERDWEKMPLLHARLAEQR